MVALAVSRGYADTPASQVYTQTVQPTQTYPEVPANGEGWFDVGGFCKVVDVGDLSAMSPPASGVPVFVPGPADQWENYRTSAPVNASYAGHLTLTTCCRPQASIGTLCADTAHPIQVDRQYGKLGETDQPSAVCTDIRGDTFTDTLSVSCKADPSSPTDPAGPDGQAVWDVSNESCTDSPWTSSCNATCSGGTTASGTTTTYDSCGRPQSTSVCSINCCTPVYSYACSGSSYIATDTTCKTGSHVAGTCSLHTVNSSYSCASFGWSSPYDIGGGCSIEYQQCNADDFFCPDYCDSCTEATCTNKATSETCNGVHVQSLPTCPTYHGTCHESAWEPP